MYKRESIKTCFFFVFVLLKEVVHLITAIPVNTAQAIPFAIRFRGAWLSDVRVQSHILLLAGFSLSAVCWR